MNIYSFILTGILISLSSCTILQQGEFSGNYECVCRLHGENRVVLQLYDNANFTYQLAYVIDTIYGSWALKQDTLLLRSPYFDDCINPNSMAKYKYTNYSIDEDAYIRKKNKLYALDKDGNIVEHCFLKKVR